MAYALGVDIGTTYTAAAIWRDGRAETVPLGDRGHTVPSALFLREDGVMLVGEAASTRGTTEPDRIARDFKHRLGDEAPFFLGDRQLSAEELTGYLLQWVLTTVTEREGGPPAHTTLTCPATWREHQRQRMTEAAATAGLTGVGLLPEPVAAGVYYASQERLAAGATVAVYDLGGGTFDATVIRKTDTGFAICGTPGGDPAIGGNDVDQVVMDHVALTLGAQWTLLDTADPVVLAGLAQLRANAVAAKEALSSDVDATIPVILPDVTRHIRLTRGELETGIRIRVLQTVDTLARTLASADVEPADLHAVLLVGGSSRIPLVSRLIASELGVPVAVDAHPKYAVCLGAAISAASRLAPAAAPPAPAPAAAGPAMPPAQPAVPPAPPVPLVPPVPPAGLPPPAAPDGGSRSQEGAELLAPDQARATGTAAVAADPVRTGVAEPIDVLLRPVPDPARVVPRLTDRDEPLTVIHTGDVRRGRRAVLLVAAAAAVLLVAVTALSLATPRDGGDEPDLPPTPAPPTAVAGPVGAAATLRAQTVPPRSGDVMRAVTAGAAGVLVAVGESGTEGVPRAWRFASGRWAAAPGPTDRTVWRGAMNGVAAAAGGATGGAGGARFVAVGWIAPRGEQAPAGTARRSAIWTSGDGRDWRLLPAANLGAGRPDAGRPRRLGELFDVAAVAGGGFLATGVDWGADPESGDGAVLTSADGRRWQPETGRGLDGPGPATLRRLLPGRGGEVVAVGARLDGSVTRSVMWRSADARSWTEVGVLPGDGPGTGSAWALARGRDGSLIVMGAAAELDGTAAPVLWTGRDAASLRQRRVTGAAGSVYGVTVVGDVVTAVGARQSSGAQAAAAWTVRLR